jgi:hypothetical protein
MKPHNLPHTCVMRIGLLPVKGKTIFCCGDRIRTIIETIGFVPLQWWHVYIFVLSKFTGEWTLKCSGKVRRIIFSGNYWTGVRERCRLFLLALMCNSQILWRKDNEWDQSQLTIMFCKHCTVTSHRIEIGVWVRVSNYSQIVTDHRVLTLF